MGLADSNLAATNWQQKHACCHVLRILREMRDGAGFLEFGSSLQKNGYMFCAPRLRLQCSLYKAKPASGRWLGYHTKALLAPVS